MVTHSSPSRIMFVSCVSQEGIKELQERIHHSAISAIDHDTREHIIGMQVCSGKGREEEGRREGGEEGRGEGGERREADRARDFERL